tara:strand:+ start:1475 stop:1780 length:306 start_codon:yes stop_codon:yes gene_type:complete
MLKGSKKILKSNFFEKGGIANNATFISFIVFLMAIQIGISFKTENTIISIRDSEKKIFDLGMKSMSLRSDMMELYKRSVIESKLKQSELKTSDKLPFIIEK